jgi:hypothetical protein
MQATVGRADGFTAILIGDGRVRGRIYCARSAPCGRDSLGQTVGAAPLACGDARIPAMAHRFIPHISRTVWFRAALDRCARSSDRSPTRPSAFRPGISLVSADRASVLRCRRSMLLAGGRCCCCHSCCQLSGGYPVASRPGPQGRQVRGPEAARQCYALRACSRALLTGQKPAFPLGSRGVAGDDHRGR